MKLMKSLLLMVMIWGSTVNAQTIDSANYFRVWQGFQRSELSSSEFNSSVAEFMKLTVDLYKGRALNNYIVIIPPVVKPSFIPDELALVALSSKESYDQIRATPEGQAYSAKHWDVFDNSTSKSAPMIDFTSANPSQLNNQTAYDMIGRPNNWAVGYTTVFIGTKKSGLTSEIFLSRLHAHVKLAKTVMVPKGLKGYIFIANENYEIAYLNWESKQAHEAAGSTEGGQSVFNDAKEIMDVLMYQQAKSFNAGDAISAGQGYSTLQR